MSALPLVLASTRMKERHRWCVCSKSHANENACAIVGGGRGVCGGKVGCARLFDPQCKLELSDTYTNLTALVIAITQILIWNQRISFNAAIRAAFFWIALPKRARTWPEQLRRVSTSFFTHTSPFDGKSDMLKSRIHMKPAAFLNFLIGGICSFTRGCC